MNFCRGQVATVCGRNLIAPAMAPRVVVFTQPFSSSAIEAVMAAARSSGVSAFQSFRTVVVSGRRGERSQGGTERCRRHDGEGNQSINGCAARPLEPALSAANLPDFKGSRRRVPKGAHAVELFKESRPP